MPQINNFSWSYILMVSSVMCLCSFSLFFYLLRLSSLKTPFLSSYFCFKFMV